MKISWYIPDGEQFARVEEELIHLSENQLIFEQKGKTYSLKSAYNLSQLLIDDVLYAFQIKDRLYPLKGDTKFNSEILMRKYVDIEPDKLAEIVDNSTIDLKNEIEKLKKLIQFEMRKNAEDDIKKMDFLQNVDSYRSILYKRFLDFFKENGSNKMDSLNSIDSKSVKINPEDLINNKIPIKQMPNQTREVDLIPKNPQKSTISDKSSDKSKESDATTVKKVNLVHTNKRKQIQNMFK